MESRTYLWNAFSDYVESFFFFTGFDGTTWNNRVTGESWSSGKHGDNILTAKKTYNITTVTGWCESSREKKEAWDLLDHLAFQESLYVHSKSELIRSLCAFNIVYEIVSCNFRVHLGEMERMEGKVNQDCL